MKRVHAITTGRIKFTRSRLFGEGAGPMQLLREMFSDPQTHWLPVFCWVIEHGDGLIVVDTGLAHPVSLPPHLKFFRRVTEVDIREDRRLGPQMRNRGLPPEEVRWVVLTHLHADHTGGLEFFPNAEVLVSRTEWQRASGWGGRLRGYDPHQWPDGFEPTLVDFDGPAFEPWAASQDWTGSGDIWLVPTPGHTAGHMSVILEEERGERYLFFAGDAAYSEELLVDDRQDGVSRDRQAQHETREKILNLAASEPTVFLPTHEWEARGRLVARKTVPADRTAARPNIPLYVDLADQAERRTDSGQPV